MKICPSFSNVPCVFRLLALAAPIALFAPGVAAADEDAPEQTEQDAANAEADAEAPAEAPEEPARPVEEEVIRGPDDRLRFRFQSQPWLSVLQWLAQSSQASLDWQDAPEGELNLVTQESYTLDEARDLINMHLLARGFTLLRRGEVLSLVKLEDVNLALVPTVTPDQLADRDAYEWVRTTFPLAWLPADKAADQFKPLLSTFGQIHPLAAANQLEVVDAVVNLRTLQERVATLDNPSETRLVREFRLEFARADDVIDSVNALLGQESNPWRRYSGESMRLQAEQERQRVELLKSMGNDAKRFLREDPVHMVANANENSILVSAAPDKIEIVKQAIDALDRPSQAPSSLAADPDRLKIYPIARIETDSVRDMLEELKERGSLGKDVEIEADYANDRLIVYADEEDHTAIARFIEQVSPQQRGSIVIPLRRLEPAYAVSAVNLMLEHLVREQSSRFRGAETERFRIESDEVHRRLLLWATTDEERQVRGLLEQLGEAPQAESGAAARQVRVVAPTAGDSDDILNRLRTIWPQISDHPLRIESGETRRAPSRGQSTDAERNDQDRQAGVDEEESREETARSRTGVRMAVFEADSSDETTEPNDSAPVVITTGADGQLLVVSADGAAADRAADLIEAMGLGGRDENVFQLEFASAYAVQYQLEEIFEASGEFESSYGYYGRRRGGDSSSPLASPKNLSFHSDATTNTLLVQNASDEQLQRIRSLIEVYDQKEFADDEIERQTTIYDVKFGDAAAIADVVKDVYRDLLSASDRAFDQAGGDRRGSAGYVGLAYSRRKTPQYKGLLSVGVDDAGNRLAISAPGYLMDEVLTLVKEMDSSSSDRTVAVLRTPAGLGAENLGRSLGSAINAEVGSSAAGSSRPSSRDRRDYDRRRRSRD